jgi:hypothetical protein
MVATIPLLQLELALGATENVAGRIRAPSPSRQQNSIASLQKKANNAKNC